MSAALILPRLHALVAALRTHGVRAAPQDLVLAVRALRLLGEGALASREALHAALSCTLARSAEDAATFDRVFALYFGDADAGDVPLRALTDALEARGVERERARQLADALVGGADDDLLAALAAGDDERVRELVSRAVEDTDFAGLTSTLQLAYFAQRLMTRLGVDTIEGRLGRAGGGAGEDERRAIAGAGIEMLEGLRRRARRAAERELAKRSTVPLKPRALVDRELGLLDPREVEELRGLMRRFAQRLRARIVVRRRRARRGRVDVKRTLRRSVATSGVPLRVELARRRRRRADLLVLCDVSDSVRAASLFMLETVAALSDVFRRTRSFVFVDRVAEVSALFQGRAAGASPDAAIARILAGEVLPVSNNSDYGRALRQLHAEVGAAITQRTTLVILGDGRSNYRPPEDWVLAELRRRARRLVWLSPEDRGTWGYGDSEMPRFARHADAILVVRSAADLARALDRIAWL